MLESCATAGPSAGPAAAGAEAAVEEVKEEKEAEREEAGEAWHSSEGFRDVPASLLSSTSSVAGGRAGVKRARVMLGHATTEPDPNHEPAWKRRRRS